MSSILDALRRAQASRQAGGPTGGEPPEAAPPSGDDPSDGSPSDEEAFEFPGPDGGNGTSGDDGGKRSRLVSVIAVIVIGLGLGIAASRMFTQPDQPPELVAPVPEEPGGGDAARGDQTGTGERVQARAATEEAPEDVQASGPRLRPKGEGGRKAPVLAGAESKRAARTKKRQARDAAGGNGDPFAMPPELAAGDAGGAEDATAPSVEDVADRDATDDSGKPFPAGASGGEQTADQVEGEQPTGEPQAAAPAAAEPAAGQPDASPEIAAPEAPTEIARAAQPSEPPSPSDLADLEDLAGLVDPTTPAGVEPSPDGGVEPSPDGDVEPPPDGGVDPSLDAGAEAPGAEILSAPPEGAPEVLLLFIQWSSASDRRVASLRGPGGRLMIIKEGDIVEGMKVTAIRRNSVEFQWRGNAFRVEPQRSPG